MTINKAVLLITLLTSCINSVFSQIKPWVWSAVEYIYVDHDTVYRIKDTSFLNKRHISMLIGGSDTAINLVLYSLSEKASPNGFSFGFFPNNSLPESFTLYRNFQKDGTHFFWNEKGHLSHVEHWEDNRVIKIDSGKTETQSIQISPNSFPIQTLTMTADTAFEVHDPKDNYKDNGTYAIVKYNEKDGFLMDEFIPYYNGVKQGHYIGFYHDTGLPKIVGRYHRDKKDGGFYFWNKYGQLTKTEFWVNGILKSRNNNQ